MQPRHFEYRLIVIVAAIALAGVCIGKEPAASGADTAWAQIVAQTQPVYKPGGYETDQDALRANKLRYRELGLQFWDRYPQDPRRWEWLVNTAGDWQSTVASKPTLRKQWETRYQREFRPAFMASPQATDEQHAALLNGELWTILNEVEYAHRKLDADQAARAMVAFGEYAERHVPNEVMHLDFEFQSLLHRMQDSHLKPEDESRVLALFMASSSTHLQRLAQGKVQVSKFRDKPLQLQLTTFDGHPLDLAQLRGKVIYVDIWSIYCASCVAAMPGVKVVYDKYHQSGFEVVGICLMPTGEGVPEDEAAQTRHALKWLKQTGGSTWTNTRLVGEAEKEFAARYAITGVPVTWLLGRDGKLVRADVPHDELDSSVSRLVQQPSARTP